MPGMITTPLSDTYYERFRSLILTRTGLDFPPQRRDDLTAWLWRAVEALHDTVRYHPETHLPGGPPATLESLYNLLLAQEPLAWERVIDALTVSETHFFRYASQFEALRDHVLPPLIAERRAAGRRALRLWSAGCASGEEAYSLAMLLREMLPDWQSWRLEIIGTDISRQMIAQARQGVYRDWSFREDYALYTRDVYFTCTDHRYQIHESVRAMVRFEVCSLLDECEALADMLQDVDLILCRNVILYFGESVRGWVYQQLQRRLAPGGWLFVGHADPPPPGFAAFDVYHFRGTTAYRRPLAGSRPAEAHGPAGGGQRRGTAPLPPQPGRTELPLAETDRLAAEAQYRLGRWHADRQNWDDARYHCMQAIALEPTYTEVYYTLALIHHTLGDLDNAIEALRRALYLERDWALARFTLAGLYRQNGQEDKARRELRNVIALTRAMPPDAPIPGGDGLTAARLRSAAERQLASLPPDPGDAPRPV